VQLKSKSAASRAKHPAGGEIELPLSRASGRFPLLMKNKVLVAARVISSAAISSPDRSPKSARTFSTES
jgi:hypothetical protein